jgi:hypothetical protein
MRRDHERVEWASPVQRTDMAVRETKEPLPS